MRFIHILHYDSTVESININHNHKNYIINKNKFNVIDDNDDVSIDNDIISWHYINNDLIYYINNDGIPKNYLLIRENNIHKNLLHQAILIKNFDIVFNYAFNCYINDDLEHAIKYIDICYKNGYQCSSFNSAVIYGCHSINKTVLSNFINYGISYMYISLMKYAVQKYYCICDYKNALYYFILIDNTYNEKYNKTIIDLYKLNAFYIINCFINLNKFDDASDFIITSIKNKKYYILCSAIIQNIPNIINDICNYIKNTLKDGIDNILMHKFAEIFYYIYLSTNSDNEFIHINSLIEKLLIFDTNIAIEFCTIIYKNIHLCDHKLQGYRLIELFVSPENVVDTVHEKNAYYIKALADNDCNNIIEHIRKNIRCNAISKEYKYTPCHIISKYANLDISTLIILIPLLVKNTSEADELIGECYFVLEDYNNMKTKLHNAIECGNVEAMYIMGKYYISVENNISEMIKYYGMAITKHHQKSFNGLWAEIEKNIRNYNEKININKNDIAEYNDLIKSETDEDCIQSYIDAIKYHKSIIKGLEQTINDYKIISKKYHLIMQYKL